MFGVFARSLNCSTLTRGTAEYNMYSSDVMAADASYDLAFTQEVDVNSSMSHVHTLPCLQKPFPHHAAIGACRVQLRPAGRTATTSSSAFLLSTGSNVAKHDALASSPVLRVSDSAQISLTELWGTTDTCVVVFARSFGCPFCQCASDP